MRSILHVSLRLAIAATILVSVAPHAVAQPSTGTVFIGAGGFANIERFPRSTGSGLFEASADGSASGGALSMGVFLTPRVSARVEWAMTDWLEYDGDASIVYPLYLERGLVLDRPASSIVGGLNADRRRTKAGFALLGYHLGTGRASVELLGGLGWIAQTTRTTYDFRILMPALSMPSLIPLPYSETQTSMYQTVGVAGMDVAVSLTHHAAVVPSVRVFGTGGGLSVRPGVGIRWTF